MRNTSARHVKLRVGANIKQARQAYGHTQESLGRALHLTDRTVGFWESGDTIPSRGNLERLAIELDREPQWFYTNEPEADEVAA